MKEPVTALHIPGIRLEPEDSLETVIRKASMVRPDPRQTAWQRDGFSAFIHFGMNTFTDREWGDGTEDPALFAPTELDPRQWVRAAKAAGITRMILTAKHHDGFCLWPSKFTGHSVKHSPWKNGQGDVVAEFVQACRDGGINYGIYISPWDRHEPSYGDSPRYNQYFLNQLEEVLTTYEGMQEVWFDGACAEGPNGKRQEYDWPAYWSLIRTLAPGASISVRGPDVRWCGNEAGISRRNEWSVIPLRLGQTAIDGAGVPPDCYLSDIFGDDLGSLDALMHSRKDAPFLAWYPCQVNTSIRPGWFFHDHENDRVKSLSELFGIWRSSVGGNAQFLLNLPPDRRGLIHENDVARLEELGALLARGLGSEGQSPDSRGQGVPSRGQSLGLMAGARVSVEVENGSSIRDISAVVDPDPDAWWSTSEFPGPCVVTVDLPRPVRANCLLLQEYIPEGQSIEAFRLELDSPGGWREVARGESVGHQRLVMFPDADLSRFRVILERFRVRPTLSRIGLCHFPSILAGPMVARDRAGMLTIVPPDGAYARYTLDGSLPTETSLRADKPVSLPLGGTVCARSFPLTPGNSLAGEGNSITRIQLGPLKSRWRILECDGHPGPWGNSGYAIDDDSRSIWWSDWDGSDVPAPHRISIDLGETLALTGFAYLPRQDRVSGGIIMQARFDLSLDGLEWTTVLDRVDFDNVVNSRQQQLVRLPQVQLARFFRLISLRTVDDNHSASAADISVTVAGQDQPLDGANKEKQ